jgi:hypothetical protein
MKPRIYRLCREAATCTAVLDASLVKRIAKAYVPFFFHVAPDDVPPDHRYHLDALRDGFEEEPGQIGVVSLEASQADNLLRRIIDLSTTWPTTVDP